MLNRLSKRGFTLIELLVVVAIITLLIAILLPAIAKAKKTAKKAVCGSNLHQLATGLYEYSAEYQNYIPLATSSLNKQSNFWFYQGGDPASALFGVLWDAGVIKDARAAYCPAMTYTLHTFNGQSNAWPYKVGGNASCRAGFSMRADYRMQWGTTAGLPVYVAQQFLTSGSATVAPTFGAKVPMPKQIYFEGKAILCDLMRDYTSIDEMHGDGMEYVMADGSVHWAPRGLIWPNLQKITAAFQASNNVPIDNVWAVFDKGL